MQKINLTTVIPCYNEEKRLVEGFNHYYKYFKKVNYNWELIFVNDGSQDNTEKVLKKLIGNKKNIRLISYTKNKGKGAAITTGVLSSKGNLILFSDLDHSVNIAEVERFKHYFELGNKAVIGSRRVKGSKLIRRQPFLRELLGRGFTLLVKIIIDFKVKDSTCGFKVFENKTAQKIFSQLKVSGWAFDAEILYLCKKYKIKYAQAPVVWKDAKGSKVSLRRDIIGSFVGLLKIRLNDLQGLY